MPPTITHGTATGYKNGCRCEPCKNYHRDYQREYWRRTRGVPAVDHEALRDLLTELFPHGLTADCPAAAGRRP